MTSSKSPVALVAVALASLFGSAAYAADTSVMLDQASIMRLPQGVATIVVGNPLIADVSIQKGNIAVLTGKTYGTTNMLMLNNTGDVIADQQIVVMAPRARIVTVMRGIERETLSCSPFCEKTVKVGDAQANFDLITSQASQRSSLATTQGSAPAK